MDKTSDCNLVNAHLSASCFYPDMPADTIESMLRKHSIVINKNIPYTMNILVQG